MNKSFCGITLVRLEKNRRLVLPEIDHQKKQPVETELKFVGLMTRAPSPPSEGPAPNMETKEKLRAVA
jgi:sulfite reductase beta subunit-like hemoprotein